MSDVVRTYTLRYIVDQAQAVTGIQAIETAVTGLDSHFRGLNTTLSATERHLLGLQAAQMQADKSTAVLGASSQLFKQHMWQSSEQLQHMIGQLRSMPAAMQDVGSASSKSAGMASGSFAGMARQLVIVYGALKALSVGKEVLTGLHDHAAEVRQDFEKLAQDALKTLDAMRELAVFRGEAGPSPEMLAKAGLAGTKMGMTVPQAAEFFTMAEKSTGAALMRGNIGPAGATAEERKAALRKMEIQVGRWSRRVKISPETAGAALGNVALHNPLETPEEASQVLGRLDYIADKSTKGEEEMFKAFNESYGIVGGEGPTGLSPEQTMGFLTTLSLNLEPAESATHLKRAFTALRDMEGPQAHYLHSIGIDPNKENFEQSFRKFKADIDKKIAKGIALDQALQGTGIEEIREVRGLYLAARNMDVYEATQAGAAKITGTQVQALDRDYFNTTLSGQNDKRLAYKSLEESRQGTLYANAYMARDMVKTYMLNSGEFASGDVALSDKLRDLTTLNGLTQQETSAETRVNNRAIEYAMKEAHRIGLGKQAEQIYLKYAGGPAQYVGGKPVYDFIDYDKTHLFFNELFPLVEQAGGNPFAPMGGVVADAKMMALDPAQKGRIRAAMFPRPGQAAPMAAPAIANPPAPAGGGAAGAGAAVPGAPAPQASAAGTGGGGSEGVLNQILTALNHANAQRDNAALHGSPFGVHPVAGAPYVPVRV